MTALGVAFEAVVPKVDELTSGEPEQTVLENARRKARAGLELAAGEEGILVLGVDTEVVMDGRLLGKADNEGEARSRLRMLSGRTHEVLSGVVVIAAGAPLSLDFAPSEGTKSNLATGAPPSLPEPRPNERAGVERSWVTFRKLPESLIAAYLASGEWRDRAGAYAVQGLGSSLVAGVDGDLSNVIGLPVTLLTHLIPELLANAGDARLQSGF